MLSFLLLFAIFAIPSNQRPPMEPHAVKEPPVCGKYCKAAVGITAAVGTAAAAHQYNKAFPNVWKTLKAKDFKGAWVEMKHSGNVMKGATVTKFNNAKNAVVHKTKEVAAKVKDFFTRPRVKPAAAVI